jgi:general secretion pathway protein H
MVVVAIIAMASAGVGFAMRDSVQTGLEREAQRLAMLLESARAQSRATGVAVRWRVTAQGFRFEGLPPAALPQNWLGTDTRVSSPNAVLLGPEPLIGPQDIALSSVEQPARVLHVVTDGLRPFSVQP